RRGPASLSARRRAAPGASSHRRQIEVLQHRYLTPGAGTGRVLSQVPIRMELVDDVSAAPAVANFGYEHYSTCLGPPPLRQGKMRQRWTAKAVALKRTQSACPRCGAWSSAERCPQCGAHKLSMGFSQIRIED